MKARKFVKILRSHLRSSLTWALAAGGIFLLDRSAGILVTRIATGAPPLAPGQAGFSVVVVVSDNGVASQSVGGGY